MGLDLILQKAAVLLMLLGFFGGGIFAGIRFGWDCLVGGAVCGVLAALFICMTAFLLLQAVLFLAS